MNGEETLALWSQGKEAWDIWVLSVLEKKKALEKAGQWSVDWYGEGQNAESKAWIEEAAANFTGTVFEDSADFSLMHFPGPADFDGARFPAGVNFSTARFAGNLCFEGVEAETGTFAGAKFLGLANFDRSRFAADVSFENAEFLKTGGPEPCARYHRAQFEANANFTGAIFAGEVRFVKTSFSGACFDQCDFKGDALFTAVQFGLTASFIKARFSGSRADFAQGVFRGDTRFLEARFGGSRGGLMISGAGTVNFGSAQFEREVSFRQVWFAGESEFKDVLFKQFATFDGARFGMPASFAPAVFSASSSFREAQFAREANFGGAQFLKDSDFTGAKFGGQAHFDQARFAGGAFFALAQFSGHASFRGAAAEAVFSLDDVRCATKPDFSEANLAQPPALEKLRIIKPRWQLMRRVFGPAPSAVANAEMSADAAGTAAAAEADAPAVLQEIATREEPAAPEKKDTGFQFEVYEDSPGDASASVPSGRRSCRRSMLRPLLAWAFTIAAFAPLYLGQRPAAYRGEGTQWQLPGWPASLSWDGAPAWLSRGASSVRDGAAWLSEAIGGLFSTGPCVHGSSEAVKEAVFLAAKNALVLVPWENDHAIRRVYGCLYGLDGEVPIIPVTVSLYSLAQAAVSAMLFVMFLIALIERLKKK
jgi:uncharacterized protein YjbI with pentapeptide repeats